MRPLLRSILPAALLIATITGLAHADTPFLVGFELYRSDSAGNAMNDPYFFTTNPNFAAKRPTLTPPTGSNQLTSISFALSPGANTFTFTTDGPSPGPFDDIELFFNNTGTSFNPTTPDIAPDLLALNPVNFSTFSTPPSGTSVIDYGNSFGPTVPTATGATSITVGTNVLSISAFTTDGDPSGSFTILVSPEPASLCLLAPATLLFARRRLARK